MKEKRIMIPNKFILNKKTEDGEVISSLMHKSRDKDLILLHYSLMKLQNRWDDTVHTSLNVILDVMNKSIRRENRDKLKKSLELFIEDGIIDLCPHALKSLRTNTVFKFKYIPFDKTKEGVPIKYFIVDGDVLDAIILLDHPRTHNMLNTYCYLSARSYTLNNGRNYSLFGEYEVCMADYNALSDELIMKRNTVKKTITKLTDEGFIYYRNAGKYLYGKKVKQSRNTYILTTKMDYKKQVVNSIEFYRYKTAETHDWQWFEQS